MFRTPKRGKLTNSSDDHVNITPPNRVLKPKILNSLDKGPVNGSSSPGTENSVLSPGETRRGRPRAEMLNTLILEGSTSPSSIKCTYCNRVFPREKSLQAHLRTHTGERPYECDYPRCTRKFAQSGQLKTHQRLHTGEKPFICSSPNCDKRFTHANRHCPEHPDKQLKRFTSPGSSFEKKFDEGHNAEVKQWLMKLEKRNNKRPSSLDGLETTPKKSRIKREVSSTYSLSNDGIENSPKSELDDNISVNSENFENGHELISPPRSSLHNFELPKGPKKRWLQAVQDQKMFDSTQDLARPLNWGEDGPSSDGDEVKIEPIEFGASEPKVVVENQKRPTVLVCVQGGKSKQITSDDMQGAIALVELKNGQKSCVNYNYRL
ncbi:zinc finger protein 367 [Tribolium castaneum]|uniref:Transcriptional activator cubitus interruptus-like Protein n=1 Tax=Tribolium castaneum TaxID=7070 RepID=D6W6S6_TRICA|nr:PREDICTED: zinc finger protein 367 [Tribolium castaneum]EFA11535.1 Transcriptional activator cubitus interruptus-like Protein [Tribolium castaneum]|eukprot:XP_001811437.2 PREDICTED: zinc finger protein 367 [Tribolium castaneum]